MMKLQDLIATVRSLFGCCRPTLGFIVLPFVRVALFPSPASCGSYIVPKPCHMMDLGLGSHLEGRRALNASRPVPSAIPLLPSFLLLLLFLFLFLMVFALTGCLNILIF